MVSESAGPSSAAPELHLPVLVFGAVEVRRLGRELEELEAYLQQASIRQTAAKSSDLLPRVSRLLDALAAENNCSLLKQADRTILQQFLLSLATAPAMHISFASDPSSAFMAKLVAWLRTNVHPLILVQIGLQPAIAAGCVLRTTNRIFDLSLRQHFSDQKQLLIETLREKVAA